MAKTKRYPVEVRERAMRLVTWAIVIAIVAMTLPISTVLSAPERASSIMRSGAGVGERGGLFELDMPPPAAVRRAGHRELREFKEGRAVVVAIGCLACHRIGDQGNRGPGAILTRIGSKLTSHEIRYALLRPRAPMPSFKRLSRSKLRVVVRFLSLLR